MAKKRKSVARKPAAKSLDPVTLEVIRNALPAIVQELGTTTVLFKGDTCTVAASGELIIKVGGA